MKKLFSAVLATLLLAFAAPAMADNDVWVFEDLSPATPDDGFANAVCPSHVADGSVCIIYESHAFGFGSIHRFVYNYEDYNWWSPPDNVEQVADDMFDQQVGGIPVIYDTEGCGQTPGCINWAAMDDVYGGYAGIQENPLSGPQDWCLLCVNDGLNEFWNTIDGPSWNDQNYNSQFIGPF